MYGYPLQKIKEDAGLCGGYPLFPGNIGIVLAAPEVVS